MNPLSPEDERRLEEARLDARPYSNDDFPEESVERTAAARRRLEALEVELGIARPASAPAGTEQVGDPNRPGGIAGVAPEATFVPEGANVGGGAEPGDRRAQQPRPQQGGGFDQGGGRRQPRGFGGRRGQNQDPNFQLREEEDKRGEEVEKARKEIQKIREFFGIAEDEWRGLGDEAKFIMTKQYNQAQPKAEAKKTPLMKRVRRGLLAGAFVTGAVAAGLKFYGGKVNVPINTINEQQNSQPPVFRDLGNLDVLEKSGYTRSADAPDGFEGLGGKVTLGGVEMYTTYKVKGQEYVLTTPLSAVDATGRVVIYQPKDENGEDFYIVVKNGIIVGYYK